MPEDTCWSSCRAARDQETLGGQSARRRRSHLGYRPLLPALLLPDDQTGDHRQQPHVAKPQTLGAGMARDAFRFDTLALARMNLYLLLAIALGAITGTTEAPVARTRITSVA